MKIINTVILYFLLFPIYGQEIETQRYAIDSMLLPSIEILEFSSSHGHEENRLTKLNDSKLFWTGGSWFGDVSQDLFEKIDNSKPMVFDYSFGEIRELDWDTQNKNATWNIQLKDDVMRNPFNEKYLRSDLRLIDIRTYELLLIEYNRFVLEEINLTEYYDLANIILGN